MDDQVFFVAEVSGTPIGMITGGVSAHPYPSVRTLVELFWWVDEEYRGSRAGLLLLDTFLAWGDSHADLVAIGTITGRTKVGPRGMARRGLTPHEVSYVGETGRIPLA